MTMLINILASSFFVDVDTLIFCEKSWSTITTIKARLFLFKLISGLKVNFHKCLLFSVNISLIWLKIDVGTLKKVENTGKRRKYPVDS